MKQVNACEVPGVFQKYACYYDSLYSEKDYEGETDFVLHLLHKHGSLELKSLLDVGCGTGGHMIHFAQAGLNVTGLDVSEAMVRIAQEKISRLSRERTEPWKYRPAAVLGDIRSFKNAHRYEAAVAMFAVVGYLTHNVDLVAALTNIRSCLALGACFVFDVWFGPAVYSQKPETRIKELFQGDSRTIRLAVPEIDHLRNVVSVNYMILQMRNDQVVSEIKETHEMRFFFIPELESFLGLADFKLIDVCPFMVEGRVPTTADWNISVVAKAV
jgi:SAM-dependent methyltransferase